MCPALFIHGRMDDLVSFRHSKVLNGIFFRFTSQDQCKGFSLLVVSELMTHNDMDLQEDLLGNILEFLKQIKVNIGLRNLRLHIRVPEFSQKLYE